MTVSIKTPKVFQYSKYNAERTCRFLEIFALSEALPVLNVLGKILEWKLFCAMQLAFLFVFLGAHQGYLNSKETLLGTREEIWLPFKSDTTMACRKN